VAQLVARFNQEGSEALVERHGGGWPLIGSGSSSCAAGSGSSTPATGSPPRREDMRPYLTKSVLHPSALHRAS
jgi:hypothetical protein